MEYRSGATCSAITLFLQHMNANQLMNEYRTFLEEEGKDLQLNDLIERINVPHEEVRLCPKDKLKLICSLKVMSSVIQSNTGEATDSPSP